MVEVPIEVSLVVSSAKDSMILTRMAVMTKVKTPDQMTTILDQEVDVNLSIYPQLPERLVEIIMRRRNKSPNLLESGLPSVVKPT